MLCLGSGSGKEEKEKRAEEKRRKKEPSRIPCASASVRAGQRQDKKEEKSGNPPLPCFAKTAWFHVEGEHAKKRKQREKEKGQTDSRYGPLALYILQVQFPHLSKKRRIRARTASKKPPRKEIQAFLQGCCCWISSAEEKPLPGHKGTDNPAKRCGLFPFSAAHELVSVLSSSTIRYTSEHGFAGMPRLFPFAAWYFSRRLALATAIPVFP